MVDGSGNWIADDIEEFIKWLVGRNWIGWARLYPFEIASALLAFVSIRSSKIPFQILAGIFAVSLIALDLFVWKKWRKARKLRYKWDNQIDGALLYKIKVYDTYATAKCWRYKQSWDDIEKSLDVDKGTAIAELDIKGKHGSPFKVEFSTAGYENPGRSRQITFYFKPLGNPRDYPPYEEPAEDSKIVIARSHKGLVKVDLDKSPHVKLVGDSGTGKGYVIRLVEVQWFLAGNLLLLIDGGKSAEHKPLDRCPLALRPARAGMTMTQRLQAVVDALEGINAIIELREELCELFDVDAWFLLPDDIKAWQPRIGIAFDEVTALLENEKDRTNDALRNQIRRLIDVGIMRGGRKYGVHMLPLSDQFAYSAVFSKGAAQQAREVIVLGNLASEHAKQAIGIVLPPIPAEYESLAGHYGKFANPNYAEIRIPPNGRDSLERAIDSVLKKVEGNGTNREFVRTN